MLTVGLTGHDAVLALGVIPVAATEWFGMRPGAIFPWAEDVLGRAGQAERLVEGVEARFAQAREQHPEFAGAAAVAAYDFGDGEVGVYGPNDPRARILGALGFETRAPVAELAGARFSAETGGEQIGLLDADVLVMIVDTTPERALVEDNPICQGLGLVAEGRDVSLVATDVRNGAYSFSSVLKPRSCPDARRRNRRRPHHGGDVMTMTLLRSPVVDELTRRRLLTGAGALGLLTVLPAAARGQEPGAFPVAIEHRFGRTTITSAPTRVVTVGVTEQDFMLALGVVPVATTRFRPDVYPGEIYPWAQDELGDAAPPEAIEYGDGYNFERIAGLRPDLILGLYSPMSEDDYDTLAEIAPTIAQPAEYPDFGVPWQELTRIVGRVFGRAQRAEELVAGVEARFAKERTEHPEFKGKTALMALPFEGEHFLYGPRDTRARVLYELGFSPPAGLEEVAGDGYGGSISAERPEILDTDVLVWFVGPEDPTIQNDPLYRTLAVHTEGRDLFIGAGDPLEIPITGFITVLSLPFLLDRLVPRIVAAIDGDPTTTAKE